MSAVYTVRCPYCFAGEGVPCRTYHGQTTRPHKDRIRSYARLHPSGSDLDPLKDTTVKLLRLAADAWAADAVNAAERLSRAAWTIYDGRDFVDEEASADA